MVIFSKIQLLIVVLLTTSCLDKDNAPQIFPKTGPTLRVQSIKHWKIIKCLLARCPAPAWRSSSINNDRESESICVAVVKTRIKDRRVRIERVMRYSLYVQFTHRTVTGFIRDLCASDVSLSNGAPSSFLRVQTYILHSLVTHYHVAVQCSSCVDMTY